MQKQEKKKYVKTCSCHLNQKKLDNNVLDISGQNSTIFVYSKNEYTLKLVSVFGRPFKRQFQNGSSDHRETVPTALSEIDISVEFEDEPYSFRF